MTQICFDHEYPVFANLEIKFPQLPVHRCQFDCNKEFNSNADRLRHERTHSDTFKLFCKICNYKTAQASNLKRHYKSKHRCTVGQERTNPPPR